MAKTKILRTQLQTTDFLNDMLNRLKAGVHVLTRNSKYAIIEVTRTAGNWRRRQKPIQVEIPIPYTKRESALYAWIIDSLTMRMTTLLPFAFENQSVLEMARQLYRNSSKSHETLNNYTYSIWRFSHWLKQTPDQIITACKQPDGTPDSKALYFLGKQIDDWAADLAAEGLASNTVANYIKGPKVLVEKNRLKLSFPFQLKRRITYKDRSPKPEELQRLINLANIRDKTIIALAALGGFREGTLAQLRYYHVKEDLERNVIPIHVHVEAEITKGKYHDYDTFVGREGVEYLQAYMDRRRRGSPRGRIPPEDAHDDSPLFRVNNLAKTVPLTRDGIQYAIRRVYFSAGFTKKRGPRYELRFHSIRKYFKTQLTALGVNSDYIEYMMGHTVSTYHDIQMKGIEFLRNVYIAADLSIRPRTRYSKIEHLKELCRVLGYDPQKVLVKDALMEPHRTYLGLADVEEHKIETLRKTLKELLKKELLDAKQ